ncbi:hypothetical protein [Pseudomonas sp. REB1044]|uniref:hypothetical protein n=1 Tax=Pseudomonas sp. REB1044 TaxID=2675224 RepID=UPI00315CE771
MEKTLDDLIARLTEIRAAEGKNIDIIGPGLDLVREYQKAPGGETECHAVRLGLSA